MMTKPAVYQVSDWSGSSGDRWASNQRRLDAMLEVFGEAAIAAADPRAGEHVLDIGCGAGASSFVLADRVGPEGQVLGLDISPQLIERARELGEGAVDFALDDAATAELAVQAYHLLFSRFGVMFFADPAAAFTHMRAALKTGGRLAFVCWRGAAENDWVRLPMGAIRDILPPPPAPDPEAPGPFSFGDAARVERLLVEAGFTGIAIAPFDAEIPFGEGPSREAAIDDAVQMAFEVGPLSRALADQDETVRARCASAVHAAFAARPGERSVMIDGAAWIVTARNPG
ncbi:class I SAM-dependent methyltransferase [Sphingomonas sp. LH128]|uniref:class I SAM-dependent methyltransferase n=2 Tax=Sphingomonadaceae TaxID=41297 RepID=UPI002E0FE2B6